MNNPQRIIFWGTPQFAVDVATELERHGFVPSLVVTQPDKPFGRKYVITPPPMKQWAVARDIPVVQPSRLSPDAVPCISSFDLGIVAGYGKLIPDQLLYGPRHKTLNVHPSLLPRHRGATPVQTTLLEGDTKTGVSIMLLDNEMDHGPILDQSHMSLENQRTTYTELEHKLAISGGKLLADVIPRWLSRTISPTEQRHTDATYTKKFLSEDGLIDLSTMSPIEIDRRVRALNPEPGTYCIVTRNGSPLRVKILETALRDGALDILKVQPDGKTPMDGHRFFASLASL